MIKGVGMENELDLDNALKKINEKGTKLVWLGIEPTAYISKLLDIDSKDIRKITPEEIIYSGKDDLKKLEEHVFVCYHGSTSGFLVDYLKKTHQINGYNLKGGVTSIVGEIF